LLDQNLPEHCFQQAITNKKQDFDIFCKSYDILFFSLSNEHMLLATAMATMPKIAQNCQILSKSIQRQLA
jgi:hypothetical protein